MFVCHNDFRKYYDVDAMGSMHGAREVMRMRIPFAAAL